MRTPLANSMPVATLGGGMSRVAGKVTKQLLVLENDQLWKDYTQMPTAR